MATRPPADMVTRPPAQPRPGLLVGKYQLIRELGRGGMGSVFLARDTRLGRLAAIKFLSVTSPELAQRFIAEARTTALCNHENIVVIYDADEHDGMPYMALEYVEGETLQDLMARQQPTPPLSGAKLGSLLSVERTLELAIPILRALHRAHGEGIVHRDLKPANIMLTRSGTIKVLDFGIAKVLADGDESPAAGPTTRGLPAFGPISSMTRTGALMGTLPYMSPEQLCSEGIDHRSDIWAMGIILFHMVTGQHPLHPVTQGKLLEVLDRSRPMPSLKLLRPDLGRLGEVIDRCLHKSKEERTATVQELLAQLEPLAHRQHGGAMGTDGSPFTGLAAFQEADADRFYGRSEDIASVSARVRSQPLVAVIGPSGVGKSSLVRAGVIPALKRSGEGWEGLVVRPGRAPMGALVDLLMQRLLHGSTSRGTTSRSTTEALRNQADAEPVDARGDLLARLAREPGHLGAELRTWAQRKMRKVVIFVDQFEEIYTQSVNAAERAAFLSCLAAVADDASSPLRVVFSMRSDFIERMAEARDFMNKATNGLIFLAPIGRDGLREALTRPIQSAGYQFESPAMIESMLGELEHTSGALPLLQFTAANLWENRDRTRKLLTEHSYRTMGGVAGTLARHADAVLAGMNATRVALTRGIFERLVTPERTRAIVSVNELRELAGAGVEVESVLQDLSNARLLVIETGGDEDGTVEIVHESLIAGWPTLTRWLDENQEDVAFITRLRAAAKEWARSGQAEGMLWRGDTELEARRWAERYQGPLSEREQRYLQAVFALANRSQRRRRALVVGIIAILTLMVVAAGVALVSIRQAQQEASQQAIIVQRQLDELERKEADLKVALDQAQEANQVAVESQKKLEVAFEDAQKQRALAMQETAKAKKSEQVARKSERNAKKAKKRAQRAANAEKKSQRDLQAALERRNRQLELFRSEAGGDIRDTLR